MKSGFCGSLGSYRKRPRRNRVLKGNSFGNWCLAGCDVEIEWIPDDRFDDSVPGPRRKGIPSSSRWVSNVLEGLGMLSSKMN
jgi:hypothetical protein